MFWKKQDDLLEHRVKELEKQMETLNSRFAIKLVQQIVFGAAGAILFGALTAMIGGVPWIG